MRFILPDMSDLHMTDSQSIAFPAFASRVLMLLLVDETLLRKYVITRPLVSKTHLLVWKCLFFVTDGSNRTV